VINCCETIPSRRFPDDAECRCVLTSRAALSQRRVAAGLIASALHGTPDRDLLFITSTDRKGVPPVLTQLKPPLPLETSKGPGWAHFVLDYGPEVVFAVGRVHGQGWSVLDGCPNHEVRMCFNWTLGRRNARGDCRRAGRARRNGKRQTRRMFSHLRLHPAVCRKTALKSLRASFSVTTLDGADVHLGMSAVRCTGHLSAISRSRRRCSSSSLPVKLMAALDPVRSCLPWIARTPRNRRHGSWLG